MKLKYNKKIFVINILMFFNIFLISITASFSSEKNVTYMQILQNPNDLDLILNMLSNRVKWVILNKQFLRLKD